MSSNMKVAGPHATDTAVDAVIRDTAADSRRLTQSVPAQTYEQYRGFIESVCTREDLSTFDPYDIWKTRVGLGVKQFYNNHTRVGTLPAAALALFDCLLNNKARFFYTQGDYPIVRAMAAMSLLNLYRSGGGSHLLSAAERHLDWLVANRCAGYAGYCWGLGFPHAVSREVIYSSNTPFSTITAYPLEAFIDYAGTTGDIRYQPIIEETFRFFDEGLKVMDDDGETMATSYGPFQDRLVINAVSYTMFAYSSYLPFAPEPQKDRIEAKAEKLYAYIRRHQRADGSWLYSPQGKSFIDCFHSCIVLKNVIKSSKSVKLQDSQAVVNSGYKYLVSELLDERHVLFRRFAVKNKQGIVRFDLYDNAEALNLALMTGDEELAQRLLASIVRHFVRGQDIYSQIDMFGALRNRNTLRWAVMPFLYALSGTMKGE